MDTSQWCRFFSREDGRLPDAAPSREAIAAPPGDRLAILDATTLLEITADATALSQLFLEGGVVPRAAANDAMHIAIATVSGVDFLVT